jgi:ankyrin repeat protein
VQDGADIKAKDKRNQTALLRAAENGHYDIVQLLLNHGADVADKDNFEGYNPLFLAAKGGHRDIVQLLMRHGANVHDSGSWGKVSALHVAAERGHLEIVRSLLAGVAVNIPTMRLETPLHFALLGKEYEVARILVEEYDANVNAFSGSGQTPFHFAIEDGNEDLVSFFIGQRAEINSQAQLDNLDHKNVLRFSTGQPAGINAQERLDSLDHNDVEEDYGGTALHCAAVAGKPSVMQILLHHSPDLDIRDAYGRTALHKAAIYGHEAIVKLLLEHGSEAHSKDNKGWTALCHAARHGHKMVMELLLSTNGFSQESEDMYQGMVLLWAAENGDETIVQQMLDMGANIEAKDIGVNDGQTPLVLAAYRGHDAIVQQLLTKGADREAIIQQLFYNDDDRAIADARARTFNLCLKRRNLKSCLRGKRETMIELVFDVGNDRARAMYSRLRLLASVAACGYLGVVKLPSNQGVDVTVVDEQSSNSLIPAAEKGHTEAARHFRETWVDTYWVKDGDRIMPLISATENGNIEEVELLNEKGEDQRLAFTWSRLSMAAAIGHVETVRRLLENGAAVTVTSIEGSTPLSLATRNGHVEVVKLLLENGAE